jgi:hypothetical protein
MRTVAFMVIGLLISLSAAGAEPCKTQGAADAKELTFDWWQQDLRQGFFASVDLGLSPPTFPMKGIEKIAAPCSRGTFTVGSDQFELFWEADYDTAPRWAVSVTKTGTLYYLALMPRPEAALTWAQGKRPAESDGSIRFGESEWMHALVVRSGLRGDRQDFATDRQIFVLFDKIPTDERLKEAIKDVGEGRRSSFATYNDIKYPPKFELKAPSR